MNEYYDMRLLNEYISQLEDEMRERLERYLAAENETRDYIIKQMIQIHRDIKRNSKKTKGAKQKVLI